MMKSNSLIIIASAIVALSAGFWLSSIQKGAEDEVSSSNQFGKLNDSQQAEREQAKKNFSPIQGILITPARKIHVPALSKDNGETFTINDLTGDWHLLFFGYTHCPDICPTTMGVTAQAKKIAETENKPFPQLIFVSVDPERDTIEMIGEYVRYFDKDFTAVTGKKDLIKALTLQMSVVYMQMPASEESPGSGYLIDHSAALLLLNPQGKLVAFLNPPHNPSKIIEDIQTVINLAK